MAKSKIKNRTIDYGIKDHKLAEKYLDVAGSIIVALNTKGKITFINKTGCRILGYKKEELIGKNWFSTCILKEQRSLVKKAFDRLLKSKINHLTDYYENSVLTKSGEKRDILWHNTVIKNGKIKIIGTLSSGEDITERKEAERLLLESQRKLSDIVEFFPDAVLAINKEKKVIIWNKAIEKMSGVPAKKMLGKGNYAYTVPFYGERRSQFMDLIFKKDKKLISKYKYKNVVRTGDTLTAEVFCNALYKNKGAWLFIKAAPLHDRFGNVVGAIESLRDITERKIAEEILQKQNSLINGISDNLDSAMIYQAIILKDGSRKFTYLSNSVKKFYGISPEEGMRNPSLLYSRFHKDDIKELIEAENKAIKSFTIFRHEARVINSLGNIRWSSFVSKPRRLENGAVCFDGIEFDISERKKVEEKLKQSEERFHNLFENANDAIWLLDGNMFVDCNKKAVEIFGYKTKKSICNFSPAHFSPVIQPDGENSNKKAKKHINAALKGNPQRFYWQHKKKNGDLIDTEISLNAITLHGKKYVQAIGRDITERRKVEQKIKESEEKYRILFEKANDGIVVIQDWKIVYGNKATGKMYGDSISKIIGHKFTDYVPKDELPRLINSYKDRMKNGSSHKMYETVLVNKNGKRVFVELNASPILYNNRRADHVILRDVTERKKAEEKIRQSEEKVRKSEEVFRKIFESSPLGIALINLKDKKIHKVNESLCKMVGYTEKELIKKGRILNLVFKDDFEKAEIFCRNLVSGKTNGGYLESRIVCKDGSIIWVLLESSVIRDLAQEEPFMLVMFEDITERKNFNEAKDNFLSIASHQLRTPLSATKWVLESISEDNKNLTPKQLTKFKDLTVSNERLINLVNRLLDVTKIESGKLMVNKKNVNLEDLVNDIYSSFRILAEEKGKNIKIISSPGVEKVFSDPVLITEAVENLLSNAIDYSAESSKDIIIKIENRKDDYLISVHNDGNIEPALVHKINFFEKFVRGKAAVERQPSGSGLGLFITKKVAEANGGDVWFESKPESGTTFYLTINKK